MTSRRAGCTRNFILANPWHKELELMVKSKVKAEIRRCRWLPVPHAGVPTQEAS